MSRLIHTVLIGARKYGIRIIVVWAVVLGVQNLVTLFILSESIRGFIPTEAAPWITVYQITSVLFSLAFFAAAVGLWRLQPWGRQLFLVTAILFFLVSLFGVYTIQQDQIDSSQRWLRSIRYIISTLLPLAYLNMAEVKARFHDTQKGLPS